MRKKTRTEIKHVLNKIGFDLIGDYISGNRPIVIKCNACGNEEKCYFYSLQKRIGKCKKCSPYAKHNFAKISNIVKDRGGKVISDKADYKNVNSSITVRCNKDGHTWRTKVSSILNGTWCAKCAKNLPYTYDYVNSFINDRGGRLISDKYINVSAKLDVECKLCDAQWAPTFKELLNGTWCPFCCQKKDQKKLANIFRDIYDGCSIKTGYRGFDWLINEKTGKKLELDIVIFGDGFTIAVEYNGKQHYEVVNFGNNLKKAKVEFKLQKERDIIKNRKIRESNEIDYFITFNYKNIINKKNVIKSLQKYNIPFKRDRDIPRACFDIDGTLCTNTNGNYKNATPYYDMINVVNRMYDDGWYIIISTARGSFLLNGDMDRINDCWRNLTEKQLNLWGVKFDELLMGKINADIYIDDKAFRVNEDGGSVEHLREFLKKGDRK